jgi:Tol biopolymer transport system component
LPLAKLPEKSGLSDCRIVNSDTEIFNLGRCLNDGTYCSFEGATSCDGGLNYCPQGCIVKSIGEYEQAGHCADKNTDTTTAKNCGNGTCDKGENSANCPADCFGNATNPYCPNGECDEKELAQGSCPQDCKTADNEQTCSQQGGVICTKLQTCSVLATKMQEGVCCVGSCVEIGINASLQELSLEAGFHFILTKNGDNYLISSSVPIRPASSMQTAHGSPNAWAPLVWPIEAPSLNGNTISLKVKNFGFVNAANAAVSVDEQTNGLTVQDSAISDANLASGEEATLTFNVQTAGSQKHVLMYHLSAQYGGKTFKFGDGKRKLVFVSSRDEDKWKVFSVNPDGTQLSSLIQHTSWNDFPAWTYDGSKIEFNGAANDVLHVYTADSDGANIQEIIFPAGTSTPRNVVFSPTMNMIATTNGAFGYNGPSNLAYLFSLGGNPSFSPDGSAIAYIGDEGKMYLVDSDGNNARAISQDCGSECGDLSSWSPDGQYILASGTRIIKADGTNEATIPGISGFNSCWSPSGSLIAMVVSDPRNEQFLVRRDGSQYAKLTVTPQSSIAVQCNSAKDQGCMITCCANSQTCKDCAPFHTEWQHGDWAISWYGR